MKNFSIIITTALSVTLLFVSCKKEEAPVTATITFEEPTANDTIAAGEELHMEGTISGSAELHGYTLTATSTSTQAVLHSASYDEHASAYNFHEHWINNVTDTTILKVKVDVNKDHDGNHEVKEINVVCLP